MSVKNKTRYPGWQKNAIIKRGEVLYRLISDGTYSEYGGSALWYFKATYTTLRGPETVELTPNMGDVVYGLNGTVVPRSEQHGSNGICTWCNHPISEYNTCLCGTPPHTTSAGYCRHCGNPYEYCYCAGQDGW